MKKILLSVVLLLLLAGLSLLLKPVRVALIGAFLPAYPEWPAPQQSLNTADQGEIYFSTSSPFELEVILAKNGLATPTTGLGYLTYPEGVSAHAAVDKPIPAIIIASGSGGISPGREQEYAKWFNARGVAAFVIDYYRPRGFEREDNYVFRNASVTEFDVIADSYAALKLLGTSPLIDAKRIGLIGFSYGGMASRLAMDSRIRHALAPDVPPFSLHVDTYGPCFQKLQSKRVTGAPLLTLRGTEDKSNDLAACAVREDELRALGADVTAHIYEGAGHAWEVTRPRALSESSPYLAGCEITYDENGRSGLNGKALGDYAVDAPLAEKVLARFESGPLYKDCYGQGYIVGRDDKTRDEAYADIEAFVEQVWFQ